MVSLTVRSIDVKNEKREVFSRKVFKPVMANGLKSDSKDFNDKLKRRHSVDPRES